MRHDDRQAPAEEENAPPRTTRLSLLGRERTPPAWNNAGDAGADQETDDIASVIQEIVSHADWVSGNALAILITGDTTSRSDSRTAESYDGSVAGAPVLHVKYLP